MAKKIDFLKKIKDFIYKNRKQKIVKNKDKKKIRFSFFTKAKVNPIIVPKEENHWEAWQTFNPAAIVLQDKVHFLYRAIGFDGVSRFGYAKSDDGFKIRERLDYPVFEHQSKNSFNINSFFSGGSFSGAEDPRIVRVDNQDCLYLTYTACDGGLRVGLSSIKVADFLAKRWRWKKPQIISPPGQTHKNWVIFPEKINGYYAILHSISPKISISFRKSLEFKDGEYIESYYNGNGWKNASWEFYVRGVGPPPLKTRLGWLVFYHALQKNDWWKYKVGVMILDLNNPEKILYKTKEPVLQPDKKYEHNGFKPGIIYVSGAVVKDDKLLVYYGAADSYIGVAYANLEKFLKQIEKDIQPQLLSTTLKKKHYDD